ncbi:hypothetical protein H5410_024577 [Solanum commersonii]|uniref:Uncharacterized protein n=1 Tax=Solanum commersonii TaxID=4109 RepID=A0A9J5ZME6_SOLCO|nr:hypothetical protein H5410_024577 [Solanum commersonii]
MDTAIWGKLAIYCIKRNSDQQYFGYVDIKKEVYITLEKVYISRENLPMHIDVVAALLVTEKMYDKTKNVSTKPEVEAYEFEALRLAVNSATSIANT